jgi:hypothetical protein
MATPQVRSNGIRVNTALNWPVDDLVDDVLASYVEWREGLDDANDAYRRWREAPSAEEPRRFAAYTAALDREEAAADSYAQSIAELLRWLGHSRQMTSPREEPR